MNLLPTSHKYFKRLHLFFIIMAFALIAACGSGGGGGGGGGNSLAPQFKGIVFSSVTDLDKISLAWLPAKDDATTTPEITYEVYASETENFPPKPNNLRTTVLGDLKTVVEGLSPGTKYYLLVIAVDREGNKSTEKNYVQMTTSTKPVVLSGTIPLSISGDLGLGIAQINGNEYRFKRTGVESLPKVGSVFIGESTAGGFIRKVDLASIVGSEIVILTSDTSLSDIVEQGTINTTMKLFDVAPVVNQNPSLNFKSASSGRISSGSSKPGHSRLKWGNGLFTAEQQDYEGENGISVTRDVSTGRYKIVVPEFATPQGEGGSGGRPNKLTGSLSEKMVADIEIAFEPELVTNLEWSLGFSGITIDVGELIARGTLTFDAKAIYDFAAASNFTKEFPFPVFTKTYTALYELGPVPVYQVTTFTLKAQLSAGATGAIKAEAAAHASSKIEFGVRYSGATDAWEPIPLSETRSTSLTANVEIKGGVTSEIRLIPNIEVKFYEVVAGDLSFEPFVAGNIQAELVAHADFLTGSFPPGIDQLTAFESILQGECFVGVSLKVISKSYPLLPKTKVCTTPAFTFFSLPTLNLQQAPNDDGSISLTALVVDGQKNKFNNQSILWNHHPIDAGNVEVDPINKKNATFRLNGSTTTPVTVFFSGHGTLGELGRQFSTLEISPNASLGSLGGTVTDVAGVLLPGVEVSLDINGSLKSTLTSEGGQYTLDELPTGEHTIRFSKTGFTSVDQTVTIIENSTVVLDVVLTSSEVPCDPLVDNCDDPNRPKPPVCEGPNCQDAQGNESSSGTAMGDPHLRTFDGLSYDFQGVGEYILAKSNTGDLEIQSRTQPWGNRRNVSLNAAIAAKVGSNRVGFYRAEIGLAVLVNGLLVELQEGINNLPDIGIIYRFGSIYTLVWPDQSQMKVSRRGDFIEITVALDSSRQGTVSGFLGHFDGTLQSELRASDGQIFDSSAMGFTDLYDVFGESWRVDATSTLFDYFDTETLAGFVDRNFPSNLLTPATLRQRLGDVEFGRITALCQQFVLLPERIDACVIDVAITGIEDGLEAYRRIAKPVGVADIQSPPSVTITTPVAGSIQSSNVTIRGTITSGFNIISVELSINGGIRTDVTASFTGQNFIFSLPTSDLIEGNNQVVVYANDEIGNTGNGVVFFVFDSSVAPEAGGDVIVINDVNAFDDVAISGADNIQFVKNLVNFTGGTPRAAGNRVLWDSSHASRCNNCVFTTSFRSTLVNEGFIVDEVTEAGALLNIAPEVKLLILWTPTVALSPTEISSLKTFASEGGRILFVGEHQGFYLQAGLNVENQFLEDMGALMRNIGQSTFSGNTILQVRPDNGHQAVANVSAIQINTVSLIELGPNDHPLLTSADGSRIVAGVARININQTNVGLLKATIGTTHKNLPPSPIVYQSPSSGPERNR